MLRCVVHSSVRCPRRAHLRAFRPSTFQFAARSLIQHSGKSDSDNLDERDVRPKAAQAKGKEVDLAAARHRMQHKAKETVGLKVTGRIIEKTETTVESTMSRFASKMGKAVTSKTAPRRLGSKHLPRVLIRYVPSSKIVARASRGVLIALPLIGAAFAVWTANFDVRRMREEYTLELALHQRPVGSGPTRFARSPARTISRSFGVAALADVVDAASHILAAYGLYQGWAHDSIATAEIMSLIAAVVSTTAAVRGEYLCARRSVTLSNLSESLDPDFSSEKKAAKNDDSSR